MDYERKILDNFKKMNEEDIRNLDEYTGYRSIYNWNSEISDEEAMNILSICKDAWLKDEYYGHSLEDYTYFISCHLENGDLSMENLNKCTKWDIIEAVENNNVDFIKDKTNQMEI